MKFEKNSPFFVECLNVSSCSFFIPTSFPNFFKHDLAGSNGMEGSDFFVAKYFIVRVSKPGINRDRDQ